MKKLFISFDFEGLAGVTNWKETLNNERYNLLATEQINTFLKGVFTSYPDCEVVIADSHMHGENLYWEKLIGNTKMIKGFPRNLYMMEGINDTFNGLVLFGYHAPIGTLGNMDHTYSSSSFYSVEINGKIADEALINTMVASHFGVPLLFLYSDSSGAEWFRKNISSEINILESKKVISRFAAELYPYQRILNQLEDYGKTLFEIPGFLCKVGTIDCKIKLIDTNLTYGLRVVPGIKVVNDREIQFQASNPLEFYQMFMTIIMVCGSLKNI